MDFSLALPDEICAELGARTRARRVLLNVSVEEMAQRIGLSAQTLSHFERTGKCTLATFVRILDAFNAAPDLQSVLVQQVQTIDGMREKSAMSQRQRAYRKSRRSQ
ncbi:MAG: helix-turn-helix transcriptional regulator [Pseudomonadota bacterium]